MKINLGLIAGLALLGAGAYTAFGAGGSGEKKVQEPESPLAKLSRYFGNALSSQRLTSLGLIEGLQQKLQSQALDFQNQLSEQGAGFASMFAAQQAGISDYLRDLGKTAAETIPFYDVPSGPVVQSRGNSGTEQNAASRTGTADLTGSKIGTLLDLSRRTGQSIGQIADYGSRGLLNTTNSSNVSGLSPMDLLKAGNVVSAASEAANELKVSIAGTTVVK